MKYEEVLIAKQSNILISETALLGLSPSNSWFNSKAGDMMQTICFPSPRYSFYFFTTIYAFYISNYECGAIEQSCT